MGWVVVIVAQDGTVSAMGSPTGGRLGKRQAEALARRWERDGGVQAEAVVLEAGTEPKRSES